MVGRSGNSNWTIEDDFRLRKAAESGVSFEQLAKGDVQFSKKYTIKELHDRWHAILYDPVVSVEVSARMLEFEHSDAPPYIKSNVIGNIEDHILAPGKRKGESIRKRFYAMRKKMRDQPLNPLDTSVPYATENNDGFVIEVADGSLTCEATNNAEADQPLNSPDTSVPNATENNNGFVTEEATGSLTCEATNDLEADINIDSLLENDAFNEVDEFTEILDLLDTDETELPAVFAEPEIETDQFQICSDFTTAVNGDVPTAVNDTNSYLMELSKNLLDLDMEDDDLPIMDADGNLIDNSYIDGLSSRLLDSSNKDIFVYKFIDDNNSLPQYDYQESKSFEDVVPPTNWFESVVICTLNAEDPEIPSNDDVFLMNLVPSASQELQPTSKFTRDYSAGSKRNSRAPKKLTPKDNKFEQSHFSSPLRSEMPRNIRIKQEFTRSNLFTASKKATPIKFEPEIKRCSSFSSVLENKKGGSDMLANRAHSNSFSNVLENKKGGSDIFANRVQSNSFSNVFENKNGGSDMFTNRVQSSSFITVLENKTGGSDTFANRVKSSSFSNVLENKKGGSDMFAHRVHSDSFSNVLENKPGGSDIFANHGQSNAIVRKNDMHTKVTTVKQEPLNVETASTEAINPVMAKSLPIIEEAPLYSSDEELPNYSDVEALILDEDPSLDEQQIYLNGIGSSEHLQTFKYDDLDNQKRIMRLELGAEAVVKKDMTSRGAFAMLQGWHMKYYVKKPEVLIGRATEEWNVDIDLGREGRNCSVSRCQAMINLDHFGCFHIKNLNKAPIFVNCVELTTNKSVSLTSSCIIEIKGMSFLFETNEALVKQVNEQRGSANPTAAPLALNDNHHSRIIRRNCKKQHFGEKPYTFHYLASVLPSSIVISSDLSFSKIVKMIRGEKSPFEIQEDNAHQGKRLKGSKDAQCKSKYLILGMEGGNTIGIVIDKGHRKRTHERMEQWMDNEISLPFVLGRTRMRSLGAVASTIYSMIKFPTANGIATMSFRTKGSSGGGKDGCYRKTVFKLKASRKGWNLPATQNDTNPDKEDKGEGKSVEAHMENKPPEKVTVNDDHLDQPITIGGNLSVECRAELMKVMYKHTDAFAWVPSDMTGIPRFVTEHELKTYSHTAQRVHRKRSIAPDRRKVVKEEVEEWLKCEIVKKVRYPTWVSNPVLVKKEDDSWRMVHSDILEDQGKYKKIQSRNKHALPKQLEANAKPEWKAGRAEQIFIKGHEKLIAELPTLTALIKDEELMVYLSAVSEAVGTVLLVERSGRQMPIHYVITDKPINQILNGPKASGRLAKWAVELGAYDITYTLRNTIKGQVLADFLTDTVVAENTPNKGGPNSKAVPDPKEALEAGRILIDPKGVEYSYALRLNFNNSNNDVEYEALLAGLRIAMGMKVKKMQAFVDSKLVAS
nr:putative forkhead-associated (FHA) domain-containing protein [Tanacetum cinerariifolium]